MRSKYLSILLCLSGAVLPGQDSKKVADALRNHEFQRAEEACREILKTHPKDAKALVNLGLALEGENQVEAAIQHWESLKGFKDKAIPTEAQLDARIRQLKEKQARAQDLTGLSGALIKRETGDVEVVFYAVRDPKRKGGYLLKPLAEPEKVFLKQLTLKVLDDGSTEGDFGTAQEAVPEVLIGAAEPDGTLKLDGPEHTMLLHRTPKPGWNASHVTRYTWQATDIKLVRQIGTAGGHDTYRLPAYGFGGALAADDGMVGLLVMANPLPGAALIAPYVRRPEGCIPVRQAEMRGNFLLPVRDGEIWPSNLDGKNYDMPPCGTSACLVSGRGKPVKAIQAYWFNGSHTGFLSSAISVALEELPPPAAGAPDPSAELLGLSGPALLEAPETMDLLFLPFRGKSLHIPRLPGNGAPMGPTLGEAPAYNEGLRQIFRAGEKLGTQPLVHRPSTLSPMGTLEP